MENEIFDEIDEEVRQDKLVQFVKKNCKALFSLLLVIVVSGVCILVYNNKKKEEAALYTVKLVDLFKDMNNGKDVTWSLKNIVDNAPKNISDLAKVINVSDSKSACDELLSVYNDKNTEDILRQVAYIGYLLRKLDTPCDKKDMLAEIDKMLSAKTPFKIILNELKGYILIDTGNYDGALVVFESLLQEKDITDVMKNRISHVIDYIKSSRN